MNVFLLTEIIPNSGDEKLISVFSSKEALFQCIKDATKIRIVDNKVFFDHNPNQFRVRTLLTDGAGVNVGPIVEDVDLADTYITIPSLTSRGKFYSVAINGRTPVACSCPAFEFDSSKGYCKHMFMIGLNPVAYLEGIK